MRAGNARKPPVRIAFERAAGTLERDRPGGRENAGFADTTEDIALSECKAPLNSVRK
jgi:hypothetical protein